MQFFSAIIFLIFTCNTFNGASWSYEDLAHWPDNDASGKGKAQSPININTTDAIETNLGDLVFQNFDQTPSTVKLINNGHTLVVDLAESTVNMTMRGGGLNGVYRLAQFHFHWGSDDTKGSEHTINNKRYPLEMHMVHTNVKYDSFRRILGNDDGLAVVGISFEVADSDNENLKKLLDHIPRSSDFEQSLSAKNLFPIGNLLPSSHAFYRYQGSLTTPPCSEVVTWTLMKHVLPVSSAQLNQFRSMSDHHGHAIQNNFRPTQDLHGRMVYFSP